MVRRSGNLTSAAEHRVFLERARGAMEAEATTIERLDMVVLRLQAAVEANDLETIDRELFAYRRISFTLRESRKLRQSLAEQLPTAPAVSSKEGAAPDANDNLQAVRHRLLEATEKLAVHLTSCRRVLRDAFADALRDIPDLTTEPRETTLEPLDRINGQG